MIAIQMNEQVRRPAGAIFVPYAPDHASYINTKNKDIHSIGETIEAQRLIDEQSSMGEGITVLMDGRPVGIFGIVPIWPGLAEMWFIPDERLRNYPLFMTRGAKAFMDIAAISHSLHRQQITVRCDHESAVGWAKTIGFSIEGTLRSYGPDGSDFYMMSIVRQK